MVRSLAVLLSAALLTSCSDPGGVGSSLVDASDGVPSVVRLEAVNVSAVERPDVTGSAGRVLVGRVEDPALGTTRATAWLDFSAPSSVSDVFRNGTVTDARLILFGTYLYGWTDTASRVALRAIDEEFSSGGATSDTSFGLGSAVTEFGFTTDGSSVEVALPPSWIAQWDGALRSAGFGSEFHGFGLEPLEASAVSGFETVGTVLKVFAGGDSAYFPVASAFTRLEFDGGPSPESGVYQDGRNAGFRISLDFDDERLAYSALARGVIAVAVDTSFAYDTPAGFSRPLARRLSIVAVSEDPVARVTAGTADVLDGVFYFEGPDLTSILQKLVEGTSPLDYFEVAAPPVENGLGVLVVSSPSPPVAVLTVLKAQ